MSDIDRLSAWLASRTPRSEHDPSYATAAVALVLAPDPDALLVIRRAERPGDPWSGQMGLPGGRWDRSDPDLLATAIREAKEEVGIDLTAARLLGGLDDLKPTTPLLPRIIVRPYVFRAPRPPEFSPSEEVAGAWWVPIRRLLEPGVFGEYEVEARSLRMQRPGYRLEHGVVWGMTERILTPFLGVLDQVRPDRQP